MVETQTGASNRIRRPFFILSYNQKRKSDLVLGSEGSSIYLSNYKLNMRTFWIFAIVLFAIFTIAGILIFFSRVYIWTLYYPSAIVKHYPDRGFKLIANTVYFFFSSFGWVWFLFLWAISFYWFLFYKNQDAVFALLPSMDEHPQTYYPFYTLFWIVVLFVTMSVFIGIFKQSRTDIFFIDWVFFF